MKNISKYLMSDKYNRGYSLIIIIATSLILLSLLLNNERSLKSSTFIFNSLILFSLLFIIVMSYKHYYATIKEPFIYNRRNIIKNIMISGFWTIFFIGILFLYIIVFSHILNQNGLPSKVLNELLIPINYIFSNGLTGAALLFVFIAEILLVISIAFMSCYISVIDSFIRYKYIVVIFFTILIYFIQKRIIIYLNNLAILLLGGPERVLTDSKILIILILIIETILIITFMVTNVYFMYYTKKFSRSNWRGDVVM